MGYSTTNSAFRAVWESGEMSNKVNIHTRALRSDAFYRSLSLSHTHTHGGISWKDGESIVTQKD